jgi:hypothetical protein
MIGLVSDKFKKQVARITGAWRACLALQCLANPASSLVQVVVATVVLLQRRLESSLAGSRRYTQANNGGAKRSEGRSTQM